MIEANRSLRPKQKGRSSIKGERYLHPHLDPRSLKRCVLLSSSRYAFDISPVADLLERYRTYSDGFVLAHTGRGVSSLLERLAH